MPTADVHDLHHSSVVMAIMLVLFAVIHSGGAALRSRAEPEGAEGQLNLFGDAPA